MSKKILFVILDGIADEPGETPMKLATKPNIDTLARRGYCGIIENNLGEHPDSGISNFVLLGYEPEEYTGRGYFDAMGVKTIEPAPGTIYMRANFATVKEAMHDDLKTGNFEPHVIVTDRRAGRDYTGLFNMSKDIGELFLDGVKVRFYKSLGHRGVITMNSIGMSPNVSDSDFEQVNVDVPKIRPLDNSSESAKTAAALNKFEEETYRILKSHPENKYRSIPANFILLRGASTYKYIKSFKDKYGLKGACVAASPVIKGLARAMEMDVYEVSGATGDLKTDLKAKTLKAIDALKDHDFVALHILGTDVASHDKKPPMKRLFIEKIDRDVFEKIIEYVDLDKTMLVVASDHPTSSKTGVHISGKMPFMIYTVGIESNKVEKFDEESCKTGPMIYIDDFIEEIQKFSQ
jgi:2,3-bisphosphoglycerate-independent phosphoglycerate mutase